MKEEILQDYTDAQALLEPIFALADHYPKETVIIGAMLIMAFTIYLKYLR